MDAVRTKWKKSPRVEVEKHNEKRPFSRTRKVGAKSEVKAEAEAEVKAEVKPEVKAEIEIKPEVKVKEIRKPFLISHYIVFNNKTFPPGSYTVGEKYNDTLITEDVRDILVYKDSALINREREERQRGLGRWIIHTPYNLREDGIRGKMEAVSPSEFWNKYAKDFGLRT